MRLDYLHNHPQFISVIAEWFHHEWKHLNPTRSLEDVIHVIYTQLNTSKLPIIYIALSESNELLGTSTLRIKEMETYEHLAPWLSSIYVPEEKRHQGIGHFLVIETTQKAKEMGYETLYLFTEDHSSWYEKLGWKPLENVIHRGHPATIMIYPL